VFVADVLSNKLLRANHYDLRLRLKSFPPTRAGQFVQVHCRGLEDQVSGRAVDWSEGQWPQLMQSELTGKEPLLRRPLGIAGRDDLADGPVELRIIYRVAESPDTGRSIGTNWLKTAQPPCKISILGPLGNHFTIDPDKPKAAVIGGGAGVPPLRYLLETLVNHQKEVVAFCGARSRDMFPLDVWHEEVSRKAKPAFCIPDYKCLGIPAVIATDDSSLGFGGTIAGAFDKWLNDNTSAESDLVVYTCGPEAMMQAVAVICISRGVTCQVAMEQHMACGMGTCQSCVVKIRDRQAQAPGRRGWSFKLCCTDGPVFNAADVVW
jgi:dihydroorotate dehydrogenase electron transfer subunit